MKNVIVKRFELVEVVVLTLIVGLILLFVGALIFEGIPKNMHKKIQTLHTFSMDVEKFEEFYRIDNEGMKAELIALSKNELSPQDSKYFKIYFPDFNDQEPTELNVIKYFPDQDPVQINIGGTPVYAKSAAIKPRGSTIYNKWLDYETSPDLSEESFYLLFYKNEVPKYSSSWSAYTTFTDNPSGLNEKQFNILLEARGIR